MVISDAVLGAVAVHCALCLLPVHAQSDSTSQTVTEEIAVVGRALHRAAMILPLLLGISARLAALVPTAFLGVLGIFLFVAFSKKALIISLFALLLSYLDKHRKGRPKIIHVHQVGHHYPEIGAIEYEPSYHSIPHKFDKFESSFHSPHQPKFESSYHPSPHKLMDFKKHFLRKWPKIDQGPWTTAGPSMESALDSYLPHPHASRRVTVLGPYPPTSLYSSHNDFVQRLAYGNSTDGVHSTNPSAGITPELQKLIDKTLEEDDDDEDPR